MRRSLLESSSVKGGVTTTPANGSAWPGTRLRNQQGPALLLLEPLLILSLTATSSTVSASVHKETMGSNLGVSMESILRGEVEFVSLTTTFVAPTTTPQRPLIPAPPVSSS